MSKEFIRKWGGRESVRILSLYCLMKNSDRYVHRQEIATWIGCNPRSVKLALDPLLEDKIWYGQLERIEAKNAVLYRIKDGKATRVMKKVFHVVEKSYGKR